MSFPVEVAGVALVAGAVTGWLTGVIRRWSVRAALLDHPNERSSHDVPTPRLGGVGLAIVLLGGMAGLALGASQIVTAQREALLVIATVGACVSLVSLLDDLWSLSAAVRLLTHLAAGAAIATLIGPITVVDAGALGVVSVSMPWSWLFTVAWIAWAINAFNFMDGVDGIAGGQALVCGLGWIVFGVLSGTAALSLSGALLTGTASGFLLHNWSPARIFMGDAGSALLGFLLATVPWTVGPGNLWLVSMLILWPFLADTGFTLLRRIAQGERFWEAHRSHLYQRLVIHGRSHATVAAVYVVLAMVGLAAGAALWLGSPGRVHVERAASRAVAHA